MLILTRKPGESLYIGDNIKVVVVEVKGSQVRIGIDADKSLRIYREEIYLQILEENKKAAEAAHETSSDLEGLSEAWMGRKGDAPRGKSLGLKGLTTSLDVKPLAAGSIKPVEPQVFVKRKKKED